MPESIKKTLSESDDDDGDDAALHVGKSTGIFPLGYHFQETRTFDVYLMKKK